MSFTKKRKDVWSNAERHYCAFCNVWMGSDRQSIMIHENGKKHRENVEANLEKRRKDNLKREKEEKDLEASLRRIEQVAAVAHAKDVTSGYTRNNILPSTSYSGQAIINPSSSRNNHDPWLPNNNNNNNNIPATNTTSQHRTKFQHTNNKKIVDSWQERKRMREVSRGPEGDANKNTDGQTNTSKKVKRDNIQLGENEGHYIIDGVTYLEGSTYITIMDKDMPVQIWSGSMTTTTDYRKSKEALEMWKFGIIVQVYKEDTENGDSVVNLCDVSYIANPDDEDETVEKSVTGERLRLILGSDDIIPSSIEEARLALKGGEEIISYSNDDNHKNLVVDENTGLSSWGTVEVKKITVSQQVKNERERLRAKKAEEYQKEKQTLREVEERKMEEAKYANADDSALGAYDVWTGGKSGYKGVQIIDDNSKLNVSEMAKSLSKGQTKNITFKKKKSLFNKAKNKKKNRRTSLSDDDDDDD